MYNELGPQSYDPMGTSRYGGGGAPILPQTYPGQLSPQQEAEENNARLAFAMHVEKTHIEEQMKRQQRQEAQKYGGLGGSNGFMK